MMEWGTLFLVLGALLLGWLLYRQIRSNPQVFSRENMSKSFFTMGILALILIVFVAALVLLSRSHG